MNNSMEEAIKKSEAIGGLTSRAEKEALWKLGQKYIQREGLAIEIGTWTGGSAVILGEVCKEKKARLICIDAFSSDMHSMGNGTNSDAFQTVLKNCEGLPIDYMAGDSKYFRYYLRPKIADFIFVDGIHSLPNVRWDIEGYYQALKEGGCYFLHDYKNPCDVKTVVDEYFFESTLKPVDSSVYVIK